MGLFGKKTGKDFGLSDKELSNKMWGTFGSGRIKPRKLDIGRELGIGRL